MRPRVLLSGFFGRGNCGDEAILQVQYECFKDDFDVLISLDQHDAFDGFWNWYPYNECELINQSNLLCLEDSALTLMHVGGGGLPIGFNGGQVMAAAINRVPLAMTGVDIPSDAMRKNEALLLSYLSLFSCVASRTSASYGRLQQLGLAEAFPGLDWAFGLQSDDSGDQNAVGAILLVLRELGPEVLSPDYELQVVLLIEALQSTMGLEVVLLPFCPEDERFLASKLALGNYQVLRHWWNPRRIQRLVADAGLVVSVGRLHPLIMGANVGTPTIYIEPRASGLKDLAASKVRDFADALDFAYVDSISGGVELIKRGGVSRRAQGGAMQAVFKNQLENQISQLRALAAS